MASKKVSQILKVLHNENAGPHSMFSKQSSYIYYTSTFSHGYSNSWHMCVCRLYHNSRMHMLVIYVTVGVNNCIMVVIKNHKKSNEIYMNQ